MASFVVPVEEVLISMPLLTFFPIGLTRRNVQSYGVRMGVNFCSTHRLLKLATRFLLCFLPVPGVFSHALGVMRGWVYFVPHLHLLRIKVGFLQRKPTLIRICSDFGGSCVGVATAFRTFSLGRFRYAVTLFAVGRRFQPS